MYTLRSPLFRGAVSIAILAALLQVGARHTGPAPPLGPLLDPANGVWAVATVVEFRAEETLALPGMLDSVHVLFDDRSVPHIFASNSEDAARALGYVVARDRLFQMEMRWRTTAGRISELVGDRALSFDRYLRRLALAWSANRAFDKLDPESQVFREAMAYSEGVNAWIDGMRRRDVPLEYRLLGARPSRWEPVYSFYLAKLLGWDLSYGFASDLRRLRARARVGREATDALFPINNPIQQPIQPNGSTGPRFDFAPIPPPGEPDLAASRLERELDPPPPLAFEPLLDLEPRLGRQALGSNNWAVSPGRSAGGHALLAGDPHLGLNLPSIWYEVHISVAGDFDVYGVTIPSVPFVVIGFNRDVAWSFTNTGADVIDYYEEELDDPERPTRYLVDGEWRPLERRIEEHRDRKGRLLATDTIYFTHRGPIFTDAGRRLSMRWTVLDSESEAQMFPSIARAATVAAWLRSMELSEAPAQNGIVADRAGSIAIRSSGLFPLHPDGSGLPVRDGGNSSSDWIGFWPVERYPFALNPEQGYLASANQQPIDPGLDPEYLGADWPSPWRAIRINQLLAGDAAVTPDAMRRYQTDPGSARADYFLPFFLDAGSNSADGEGSPPQADARQAARLLAEWDGSYTKDNERAVLFEYAMDELAERTWDELRGEADLELAGIGRSPTPGSAILASLLTQPENLWWDDRRSAEVEDRDAILVASLAAALARALADHGEPDSGGWRWDGIRHLNIEHLMGLGPLSARNLPIQGGPGTLNPAFGRGTFGASWRMVVELGPELRAWTIYPGGQSGNPLSPRYDDRIGKWVDGELDAVRFPRAASDLDSVE